MLPSSDGVETGTAATHGDVSIMLSRVKMSACWLAAGLLYWCAKSKDNGGKKEWEIR